MGETPCIIECPTTMQNNRPSAHPITAWLLWLALRAKPSQHLHQQLGWPSDLRRRVGIEAEQVHRVVFRLSTSALLIGSCMRLHFS
jgi:hypothetical protein